MNEFTDEQIYAVGKEAQLEPGKTPWELARMCLIARAERDEVLGSAPVRDLLLKALTHRDQLQREIDRMRAGTAIESDGMTTTDNRLLEALKERDEALATVEQIATTDREDHRIERDNLIKARARIAELEEKLSTCCGAC